MKTGLLNAAAILVSLGAGCAPGRAQHVENPLASVADIASCQAALRAAADPLLAEAKRSLPSCLKMPFVPAPVGRMIIPRHYLTGSNGPTNPAEDAATRPFRAFESRVTAGAAQFLATGSHAESGAALDQLDAWAKAGALLDYSRDESPQAWYQVEWTLSSAAVTDSVLANDATLDPSEQKRIASWLVAVCRKNISFERASDSNNHHYWRALAAIATGTTAADDELFRFAIKAYRGAIDEIDPSGAFPKEMARHENAIHYQGFALQPLVTVAQFASRQGVDLYGYKGAHGRTLRDAIVFFGRAVDDPGLVRPYTTDAQNTHFGPGDFAPFAFYCARYGTEGMPNSIAAALRRPLSSANIGYTTIMAAK